MSLPLALRCRSVTNIDPSAKMGAAFLANAKDAGISNVDLVRSDWLAANPPQGTVALVNHVTYLTRDIVPFLEKLELAGSRRVILTVNAPPPPSWNRVLFHLVHGEAEEVVPGHAELMNVLWEIGRLPDLTMLQSQSVRVIPSLPSRAAAIDFAMQRVASEQWAHWPVAAALEARIRATVERRFDDLYAQNADGFIPRWINVGTSRPSSPGKTRKAGKIPLSASTSRPLTNDVCYSPVIGRAVRTSACRRSASSGNCLVIAYRIEHLPTGGLPHEGRETLI